MADCGTTNIGAVFSISDTAENDDLDLAGFQALTYIEVPGMGTMGDTGVTQNIVSYSTWDNRVLCKGKGEADAGSPDLEFLDAPSAGIDAMDAAAAVDNQNEYAFRVVWADGFVEYNRGLVTGPTYMKGSNEDFRRRGYSLGMNQEPVTDDSGVS